MPETSAAVIALRDLARALAAFQFPLAVTLAFAVEIAGNVLRRPALRFVAMAFAVNGIQLLLESMLGWIEGPGSPATQSTAKQFLAIAPDLISSILLLYGAAELRRDEAIGQADPQQSVHSHLVPIVLLGAVAIAYSYWVASSGFLTSPSVASRIFALVPNIVLGVTALGVFIAGLARLADGPYATRFQGAQVPLIVYACIQPLYLLRQLPAPAAAQDQVGSAVALSVYYVGYLLGFGAKSAFLLIMAGLVMSMIKDSAERAVEIRRAQAIRNLVFGVNHTFRQALGVMAPLVIDLRSGAPPAAKQKLALLGQQVDLLDSFVRRFLELKEAEATPQTLEGVRSLLEAARDRLSTRRAGDLPVGSDTVRTALFVPHETAVPVQLYLLDSAIDAILDNAVDAIQGTRRPLIELAAKSSRDGSEVWIDVFNSGPPVPPEMRERMFQAYVTTKQEGSGVGLFFARTYVELLGGRLGYVEDSHGRCVFRITLPGAQRVQRGQGRR